MKIVSTALIAFCGTVALSQQAFSETFTLGEAYQIVTTACDSADHIREIAQAQIDYGGRAATAVYSKYYHLPNAHNNPTCGVVQGEFIIGQDFGEVVINEKVYTIVSIAGTYSQVPYYTLIPGTVVSPQKGDPA